MTLTHAQRTQLLNRLNFATMKLAQFKEAEIDILMWARETKEVRKDLENED